MSTGRTFPLRPGAYSAALPRVAGLPIVGSLLEMRRDRVGMLLRIPRDYGPLAVLRMGAFGVVTVTSPELFHEILVEKNDHFVKSPGLAVFARPLLGDGLLTSEHAVHKRQRRMMSPLFVHKKIAGFSAEMSSRAESAQARWRDGEAIDASAEMMRMTLEIVGKTLFDAEVGSEAAEIGHAIEQAMAYVIDSVNALVPLPPSFPTARNRRNRAVIERLDATVYRMIRERRAAIARADGSGDRGDFLSMLLAARDEEDVRGDSESVGGNRVSAESSGASFARNLASRTSRGGGFGSAPASRAMTDAQVRDEAMTLFLAGHETTANALSWALYLLARHPAVRDRLENEVDSVLRGRTPGHDDVARLPYTLQVMKEAMRLYPPVHVVARRADRDVTIGGHRLAAGSLLMLNILGQHRWDKIFWNAAVFDPERFSPAREPEIGRYAYLPFAAGPRVCIGNHFALLEGQLALATIAQRVRLDLAPGTVVRPSALLTLRPDGGMPMTVRRREVVGTA